MATWRAWARAWPMTGEESTDGVDIPIDQGSLVGAETRRPRYQLRMTTSLLDAATIDALDPTAGVWLDLWVQADDITTRRAHLVLTHLRTSETGDGQALTDLEAVSVDALTVGEPVLSHRTTGGARTPLTWLKWAQDRGYLYNHYSYLINGPAQTIPDDWVPERGQTIEQIIDDRSAAAMSEWFGNLDGQLEERALPHTDDPGATGGLFTLTTQTQPVSSWEVERSWDQWHNGALIRHRWPDGQEVTWRVTHGKKESHPIWRFLELDATTDGMPDVVAEQLARTAVRSDLLTIAVPAHRLISTRLTVGAIITTGRPGTTAFDRIVQSFTLDLAAGESRLTLRGDITRLARFRNAPFYIYTQAVAFQDAEQVIGSNLVPLED